MPVCGVKSLTAIGGTCLFPRINTQAVLNMRTLDNMKMCEKQKGFESKKGCVRPPLIEIEPKDCVVDELHLFLLAYHRH